MGLSAPCKDCVNRDIGCHSACDQYKKFANEREK